MKTYDGLELHVTTRGPEDAPVTVVLAHCWTADEADWHYQVRDLMTEYGHGIRILTWDHRGHGRSDRAPERDCTIANLARDMGDVIDAHAPPRPPGLRRAGPASRPVTTRDPHRLIPGCAGALTSFAAQAAATLR